MSAAGEFWPYLVLLLVGFLPSDVWRLIGVLVARGVDEKSEFLIWVHAVATALLAAVIAKLVLFPPAALADVPLGARLTAITLGFLAFLVARRSVFAGVATGEVALLVGALLLAH
jgi:hypothetical protein